MTRFATLTGSAHPSSCLHRCPYCSKVSILILLPHTILFDVEQRSKEKHLAFLSKVQEQQDHYWNGFYTWFKDEETLYLIFLFFLKWEINVEQLLYSLI